VTTAKAAVVAAFVAAALEVEASTAMAVTVTTAKAAVVAVADDGRKMVKVDFWCCG
jgi:hypothetical protein